MITQVSTIKTQQEGSDPNSSLAMNEGSEREALRRYSVGGVHNTIIRYTLLTHAEHVTSIHPSIRPYRHTHPHPHPHAYIYIYTHTHTHTHTHIYIYIQTHSYMHIHIHAYTYNLPLNQQVNALYS